MNSKLVALAALAALAASASAQSKKYPPTGVDKDKLAEQRSRLWDNALHPERRTYEELVDHARPVMLENKPLEARLKQAMAELDKAVALQPRRFDAYALRGLGYAKTGDYAKCADDLEAAAAHAPAEADDPRTPAERADARKDLGACQARAGRYAAAEQTLARATQLGSKDWVVWMLLGETRIAEGKLDEAIAALTAASELDYQQSNSTLHWLLAAAYDRARMPNQVAEHLTAGYRNDRYFSTIKNLMPPVGPYLGEDEADYLLGLAWGVQPDAYAGTARPELQLAYFRRYLQRAPHSQWRRRAEEHVKELRAVEYPEAIERRYSAPLDLDEAKRAIKKGMPAMRACIGATNDVVLKVTVTRTGPHSPQPAYRTTADPFADRVRMRPVAVMPAAAGVSIVQDEQFAPDAPRAAIDAAIRCIEPIADKLALPPVKDKDTSYAVVFSVVGT